MRITDLIKTSQGNLARSKLRTFLTVLAVFIGTFAISLTNGVGNGVNAYVDKELGNVGVSNAFVVQIKSSQVSPISSDVVKYDSSKRSGGFDNPLLTQKDIDSITQIKNVVSVTPIYQTNIDYISRPNTDKYIASASQYIDGLNLDMTAGRLLDIHKSDEVTVPVRYIKPLGFADNKSAIGQELVVGYRNSKGVEIEKTLTIVGVQQESVLGNASIYITPDFAYSIDADETAGIANLQGTYQAFLVEFPKELNQTEIDELKHVLEANNYTAQTIADQIGTFSKIINGIITGLDVFGILALVVAVFGIVNTLLMSVNERTSEIGLMKALGANSRTVFGIFSLEAASIGFWGGLLGIGVSILIGTIINHYAASHFLKDFPGFNLLSFPLVKSLLTLFGIVLLAFLAGAIPSIKASRLDPIKALRYE